MTATIHNIMTELNLENGSLHKLATLRKYVDNELLQRIFRLVHDRVSFTFGLSMKYWNQNNLRETIFSDTEHPRFKLEDALNFLEYDLATRKVTGNAAIELMHEIFIGMNAADSMLTAKILGHDLRVNMGRTLVNKIWPGLIPKPAYMRCGVYNKKSAKDISFPAYIQLKADGTYRECSVSGGAVEFVSRSGESYEYPNLTEIFKNAPDGYYTGEMIVRGTPNRSESNGLLNSDDIPYDLIDFFLWDYITPEEYQNAKTKKANSTPYHERFSQLNEILGTIDPARKNLTPIETLRVDTLSEALDATGEWMDQGLEGGVLKDLNGVYKDGTSKHQLKLKISFSIDARITGFTEGKVGSKREETFGSIMYETDDGLIKGQCSGFTDVQLEEIHSRRKEYLGKIMEIEGNDLTCGRDSSYYAISHPRFLEIRNDKTETDTLQSAMMAIEMSKTLG